LTQEDNASISSHLRAKPGLTMAAATPAYQAKLDAYLFSFTSRKTKKSQKERGKERNVANYLDKEQVQQVDKDAST